MEAPIFHAMDIMKKPDKLQNLNVKYAIIYDHSIKGEPKNIIKAINLAADLGWECVNITASTSTWMGGSTANWIYALIKRIKP